MILAVASFGPSPHLFEVADGANARSPTILGIGAAPNTKRTEAQHGTPDRCHWVAIKRPEVKAARPAARTVLVAFAETGRQPLQERPCCWNCNRTVFMRAI
jgi:hypothetical protein